MQKIILLLFCTGGFFSCRNDATKNSTNNILSSRRDVIFPARALSKIGSPDTFDENDTLKVTVEGIDFLIANDKFIWGHDPADTFHLQTEQIVERAYVYTTANIAWIFYTETDNETATSRVEKINLQTKKRIWATEIYGFNLGRPYIIDTTVYVTAIGFAGKMNLGDGKYIYRFDDLYDREKSAFNYFDTILFKDDLTIFLSTNNHNKHTDSLVVNEADHSNVIYK